LEQAKLALLEEIINEGISITKFEVSQTTLEDLFMKAVQ
jgi:ABC-type uncharacterized transport system ATPase subunit